MAYGTVKVDNVTFTYNTVDTSTTFSGLHASTTNNLTLSGTASANTFTGTTANFTNANAQNISVTTLLSGLAITGGTAGFTTVTGTTVTGTTANFASGVFTTQISGVTITGTTVAATTGTFTSLTGTTTNGTTASFTTGNFTSLTGTTTTGTTANFASGVFTTQISGVTVIATTGTFTSLTGTTATFTSGIIASGTALLPSLAILSDPNTGIYSPGADQLAVATNGTPRLSIDASGNVAVDTNTLYVDAVNNRVGIGATPAAALHVTSSNPGGYGTILYNTSSTGEGLTIRAGSTSSHNILIAQNYDGSASRLSVSSVGTTTLNAAAATAPFIANIGASESARIDSSGRLLVGTVTSRSNFFNTSIFNGPLNIESTAGTSNRVSSFILNGNDSACPIFVLGKTRSLTVAGNTIVNNGDEVGIISFQAADGTELVECARIQADVENTVGANRMPGCLVFSTATDASPSVVTERMRIKADGDVSIVTGNLIIGTAGKGIDFSADGSAAGMTSELLDDYEEGTWTPAYNSAVGTLGAITYDNVQGTYVKVGRLVTITGGLYCTAFAVGTGSGDLRIGGLPFTGAAVANSISVGDSRLFTSNNPTGGSASSSNVTFYYRTTANGGINNLQVSDAATGSGALNVIYFTASYQI